MVSCTLVSKGGSITGKADENDLLNVVDVLVRAGCSPHARDGTGCTQLELAAAQTTIPQGRYAPAE